jgi:NTE family protein
MRKRVGLALGSGGARGLDHIDVIRTLEAHGIPIDIVAGSSVGSLVGGLYVALGSIQPLLDLAASFGYRDFASIFFSPTFSSGLVRGDHAKTFLESYLRGISIERLPKPFAAVTTDIVNGDTVVLRHGNLASAIIASASIPLLFEPTLLDGRYLVDGGVSLPVPAALVREMGADIVIAVNLEGFERTAPPEGSPGKPSVAQVTTATIDILKHRLADIAAEDGDVVIEPKFGFSTFDMRRFIHGAEIIEAGSTEAARMIPAITAYMEGTPS